MTTVESSLRSMIAEVVREEIARLKLAPAVDEYMSVAEAAKHARVTAGTVRRWVRAGELTRHEAGARVLVKRDELEALLTCEVIPIDRNLSPEDRAKRRFG